ncbi:hypothetical protein FOZ62_019620, partial [Perkinsus olseni]
YTNDDDPHHHTNHIPTPVSGPGRELIDKVLKRYLATLKMQLRDMTLWRENDVRREVSKMEDHFLNNVDRYIKEEVGSYYKQQQQQHCSTTTTLWMHVSMSIYKNVLEEYKQIKEDCIPQLMGRWNDAVTAYG